MKSIELDCCICLDNLNTEKECVYQKCCGQKIHLECYNLTNKLECPLCRHSYIIYDNSNIYEWVIVVMLIMTVFSIIYLLFLL